MTIRSELKSSMYLRAFSILLGAASQVAMAQPLPTVDIGLFEDDIPNTLQVRLLPHGPYGGIVSGLTFTIRWPAASSASLGIRANTCASGVPCSPVALEVVGDYQYLTYNAFAISLLVDEGCPWAGDEEVVIMTVPVINSTDLSEFRIVNDAWTIANNRAFYIGLSAVDCQGVIYAGGVAEPGNGILSGIRYVDLNADCAQSSEPFEMGVPFRTMLIQPGAIEAITDQSGHFVMDLPPGDYTLTTYTEQFVHPYCPPTQSTPFTVIGGSAVAVDLADTSSAGVDLRVLGFSGEARPGYPHGVYLSARNLGATASGLTTLTLTFDAVLDYAGAEPPPNVITSSTLTWNLGSIPPFGTKGCSAWLEVPPDALLTGTVLNYSVTATSTPDTDLANNTIAWSNTIVNSFDPNDKTARTSSGVSDTQYFLDSDTLLTYTIRFQNTGTAPALEVLVTDTLSEDLDMATFEQGVASHPFGVSFKPGRVVEWRFADVYLPDSTTNEQASHGLVQFSIKPRLPLAQGTIVTNTANIYFDFNPPVITEPSVLVAEVSTGVRKAAGSAISLAPVPASDELIVSSGEAMANVRILAADGREVMRVSARSTQLRIDLNGLKSGAYLLIAQLENGTTARERFIKH